MKTNVEKLEKIFNVQRNHEYLLFHIFSRQVKNKNNQIENKLYCHITIFMKSLDCMLEKPNFSLMHTYMHKMIS